MDEKVQLSRETIVGDDVVSEDIYPNTNTKSVNDDQSGTSLNDTLERIWAAINNKLARIVNSVNGRTGAVVLDSSDVGLENVDNVSFNDIKSWVIDELTKQFGYKKLKLFESYSELATCLQQHNLDDLFAPFYVEHWSSSDTRPYIGYIKLDQNNTNLIYEALPINGIGMTDESLIYKDTTDDTFHPEMRAGELRVKISSDEEALYVERDGVTDDKNGLKIDSSMISGVLHFYDGIYGDYHEDPYNPGQYIFEGGMLSTVPEMPGTHIQYPECTIRINRNTLQPPLGGHFYLKDTSLHKNDTVVCNFKDYRVNDGPLYVLNSEKHYVKLVKDNPDDRHYNYQYSGDGYRVGDIIDTADGAAVQAKFVVTSIKDGAFEGPIASVNLLYCDPVTIDQVPTVPSGGRTIDTKPIIRYMSQYDTNGEFPDPVDPTETSDNYISIINTSSASGFQVFLEDDDCWIEANYQKPEGTFFSLMMRGMCIGRVRNAPDRLHPDRAYEIDFNSLRPLVGNSLQYKTYDKKFHEDQFSEVMEIRTRKGHINANGLWDRTVDVSGIAIAENWGEYRHDGKSARIVPYDGDSLVEPNRIKRTAVLPGGPIDVMPNDQASTGGMTIMTDLSLCIIPHDICVQESNENITSRYGSKYAVNWSASLPYTYPTYEKEPPSYIGINLFKVVKPKSIGRLSETEESLYCNQLYMFNMSGLRVVDTRDRLTKNLVGKTDNANEHYIDDPDTTMTDEQLESYPVSGGLMVNVGAGLEICAAYDVNENWNDDYYLHPFDNSGKVCVRVDNESIEINDDNRLQIRIGDGLIITDKDETDEDNARIHLNVDHSFVFTGTNNNILSLNINNATYHEIDMMSNLHPIVNLLQNKSAIDKNIPLSAYINTKYGLGLSITGNTTWNSEDDIGAPNALIIRIKAGDIGYVTDDDTDDIHTEYRSRLVALKNDGLMFDPDGKLIAPIDTSRGLTNNYNIKAMSSDQNGNVTTKENGGIGINVGSGLTFDSEGKLTLEADYEIKKLRNGFDLNNLTTGNYYADAATSDSIDHRPTTGLGVFRVEHKPVIADSGYYIQKLYSFEKLGIVYMRYKKNNSWTGWYHIDGQIID